MVFGARYLMGLMWLVPLLILFYVWASRVRRRKLEKFASAPLLKEETLSYSPALRKLKNTIIVIAVFLMVVSLTRPQWGFRWQEVTKKGLDILIALDVSKSMLAKDVLPSRLERSKLAIRDLVRKLSGDRVGLIAFSGTAFLECPLTIDYSAFLLSLDDTTVNSIPIGGTSLARAIGTALASYEGGEQKYKVLVIITDGEDHEGSVEKAVAKARSDGIKIFCVGIGTAEGDLIPLEEAVGQKEFLKDREGNIVKSRLDEELLQKIALDTGGGYVRATGIQSGLDIIYDRWLSKMEKRELKSELEKSYFERFQMPLAAAFLLLLIEPLIGDRRRTKGEGRRAK